MRFKLLLSIGLIALFVSCGVTPHSRFYKTKDWETSLFKNSTRCVFPKDIRLNKEKYINSNILVNWIGIIKDIDTEIKNDTGILKIKLD